MRWLDGITDFITDMSLSKLQESLGFFRFRIGRKKSSRGAEVNFSSV